MNHFNYFHRTSNQKHFLLLHFLHRFLDCGSHFCCWQHCCGCRIWIGFCRGGRRCWWSLRCWDSTFEHSIQWYHCDRRVNGIKYVHHKRNPVFRLHYFIKAKQAGDSARDDVNQENQLNNFFYRIYISLCVSLNAIYYPQNSVGLRVKQ